jgi:hypothetical protein
VPADVARTSAFSPASPRSDWGAQFQRVYIVPPFSVNEVTGREVGSQHRDALYAVFLNRANTQDLLADL